MADKIIQFENGGAVLFYNRNVRDRGNFTIARILFFYANAIGGISLSREFYFFTRNQMLQVLNFDTFGTYKTEIGETTVVTTTTTRTTRRKQTMCS